MKPLIYLREGDLWYVSELEATNSFGVAHGFASLAEAEAAYVASGHPCSMEAVAAMPGGDGDGLVVATFEPTVEVEQTELRGAVELFAQLKKSSKYHGQFLGWQRVRCVTTVDWGDEYCWGIAGNRYRHEDLIFGVKLVGAKTSQGSRDAIVRLDKWVKAERKVAA